MWYTIGGSILESYFEIDQTNKSYCQLRSKEKISNEDNLNHFTRIDMLLRLQLSNLDDNKILVPLGSAKTMRSETTKKAGLVRRRKK